ncbi:unnamed protein product [Symbiodinium natans]|uniref:Uncharacterized protein n=1 Tax=Symbiodinium natans TaxID=878477 RepID=A0A812SGP0_9DINO|nr:unnamed protein product [Symbiodinium natans]
MAKKKQRGPGAGGAGAVAPEQNGGGLSQQLLSCAVKSAQWLAAAPGKGDAAVTERLLSAVKPIIFLRAAKYELDAQASKGGEANAPGKALPARKRRLEETSSPKAPSGEDVEQAVEAFKALAAQPEQLLAPSCKLLRSALHPLVEAHKREEKASPAFRITCMLGQKRLGATMRGPAGQKHNVSLVSCEASRYVQHSPFLTSFF